jgi:hypothetical protein
MSSPTEQENKKQKTNHTNSKLKWVQEDIDLLIKVLTDHNRFMNETELAAAFNAKITDHTRTRTGQSVRSKLSQITKSVEDVEAAGYPQTLLKITHPDRYKLYYEGSSSPDLDIETSTSSSSNIQNMEPFVVCLKIDLNGESYFTSKFSLFYFSFV